MSDNVQSAKDFVPKSKGRKSPAERVLDELNAKHKNTYYSIKTASEALQIGQATVRRIILDETKQPSASDVFVRGDWHIWLLTEDDVIDLAKFFSIIKTAEEHFNTKYKGEVPKRLKERLK